jgi:hypothetical protein
MIVAYVHLARTLAEMVPFGNCIISIVFHKHMSEKHCLGCNALSRITGLEEIIIRYKPLGGWLISHLKPLSGS